jgi:hypothetical protein
VIAQWLHRREHIEQRSEHKREPDQNQLSERAERAGAPTSALAREDILASLRTADGDGIGARMEEALRRTLSPDVLASKQDSSQYARHEPAAASRVVAIDQHSQG